MKKPEAITLTKLDGIIAYGPWFTSGHIETGGDDSNTHVPIGRKLMVIAKRGNPARRLEALMTSVKSLVNLLTKPPPKRFGCDVKLFFTSPDSIMVQPALWAHTVITFGNGPSLVVRFEGLLNNDGLRGEQVLKYFASGSERERQTHLLQILTGPRYIKVRNSKEEEDSPVRATRLSATRFKILAIHFQQTKLFRNPKK